MKALVQTGYGPTSLRLQEVATPEPVSGEVRIQVEHAGLNPVDYKIRDGKLRAIRPLRFPQVIGNEACGVIDRLGPGTAGLAVGDRVYTRVSDRKLGCFAEYVCVSADLVARAPESLEPDVAAGVPLVGLTALQALYDVAEVSAGMAVLIHGGAGSVGRMAVQLAKLRGAEVTTTVSERGIALVRELGADHIINYKDEDFSARPERFDVILDTVGGDTLAKSFATAAPGGMVVSLAGAPEPRTAADLGGGWLLKIVFWLAGRSSMRASARHGCSYRYYFMHGDGGQLQQLTELIEARKLRVMPVTTFPLPRFADAFALLESGRSPSKLVLSVDR